MEEYKKWLSATAAFYNVPQALITGNSRKPLICRARQTFYYLCFKNGINLYSLSRQLGKNRTTVVCTMYHTKNRTVADEHFIDNFVKKRDIDDVIERWLGKPENYERDMVLKGLIAQKQQFNLEQAL